MDDDGKIIALSKSVLGQHFGIRSIDQSMMVCACCGNLDVPWPCVAATLAEVAQIQVLAR